MTPMNHCKWYQLNFAMVILSFASSSMMFVECTAYPCIYITVYLFAHLRRGGGELVMSSIVLSGFIMSFVKDVKFELFWDNKQKLIVVFCGIDVHVRLHRHRFPSCIQIVTFQQYCIYSHLEVKC